MGLAVPCTGEDALDQGIEALMRSLSFDRDNVKATLRSVSFNGRDAKPAILKSFGSGKLIFEESKISIKSPTAETESLMKLETKMLIKSPMAEKESSVKGATLRTSRFNPLNERATVEPSEATVEPSCKKFKAAVKLQKVYKSFRTRRQLADCAVLVEQRWWKLLDFALLKQSSVSFFDIEEPESVISRWSRARRRAAKVGKGLSKDEKAQKLALQHWLEAIDPRHRYGHNLHFYYDCWLHCASKQPFFYWLDVGEGKEVNLEDKCTRAKLQHQCIKYLGPKEREDYEVIVEDGKLLYKGSGKLLDTSEGPVDLKWIFVLSTSKTLYVGQKKKGNFQHSSFLAGGATSAAGRLVVDNGILKAVWPHSGHYRPTEENFQEFVTFLKDNSIELTDVKLSPAEGDDEMLGAKSFRYDLGLTETDIYVEAETRVLVVPENTSSSESSSGANNSEKDRTDERPSELEQYKKVHEVTVPNNQDESDDEADTKVCPSERPDELECSIPAGSELAEESSSDRHYMYSKQNLFLEEQEEDGEASVPQEAILRRINSKKGMESYQLGKQLSCKWTTGAGPRIGWVRDYPSELQLRSLEQVNLSPRSGRPQSSPKFQSVQSPRMVEAQLSHLSPRSERQQPSPIVSSPRMTEVPLFRKVPLLQKPNMCRKF